MTRGTGQPDRVLRTTSRLKKLYSGNFPEYILWRVNWQLATAGRTGDCARTARRGRDRRGMTLAEVGQTLRRRKLGKELRRARETAGLSQRDVTKEARLQP